jgi:DNA-binding NtrC family response regulator
VKQLMKKNTILIVDDEEGMRIALSEALCRAGYDTVCSSDGVDAIAKIHKMNFAMVITDVKMPRMSGLDVLKEVKKSSPQTPVLMITAYGTVHNAVEAMKEGATDYLLKPFSFEDLVVIVHKGLATMGSFVDGNKIGHSIDVEETKRTARRQIITQDQKMLNVIKMAGDIAPSNSTVLIQGESGTGKELLAHYIHHYSKRREKAFVAVNCAAIPDNLLESELFGHEKGAFTGAMFKKLGKFELAQQGSILLDEISEMSMTLQAKLLRVLQEFEIDRIGGKGPVSVDVRVLSTTNRDLKQAVHEEKFREDLYYRLNVIPLTIPPLRERRGDIPLLTDHFIRKHVQHNGKKITGISQEAQQFLLQKSWGGNVRELENMLERAVLLCHGTTIQVEHFMLAEDSQTEVAGETTPATSMKEMEQKLIFQTLEEVGGNRTHAARALGISIRTLRNKLNEYKQRSVCEGV